MPKAPKTLQWTLTKQQWALFEEAIGQQQAAQQRVNDVMRSIAAGFGTDLEGSATITSADAKTRQLTLRVGT